MSMSTRSKWLLLESREGFLAIKNDRDTVVALFQQAGGKLLIHKVVFGQEDLESLAANGAFAERSSG